MSEELNEHDREELLLLYNVSIGDIAFFKQQQWSVTNHALVLHAALLFISSQLPSPLAIWQIWFLVVLAWVVCIAGLFMVSRLQNSIDGCRTRLQRVRAWFGKPFLDAWVTQKEKDEVHKLLNAALIFSSAIVTWLVLVKI